VEGGEKKEGRKVSFCADSQGEITRVAIILKERRRERKERKTRRRQHGKRGIRLLMRPIRCPHGEGGVRERKIAASKKKEKGRLAAALSLSVEGKKLPREKGRSPPCWSQPCGCQHQRCRKRSKTSFMSKIFHSSARKNRGEGRKKEKKRGAW